MNVSKVYQMAVDSYGDVRTLVRGIPYQCPDDWEEILDSLDEDSDLYLIKEPDNPKDSLAIAAYLGDRRIGYVAASDNTKIWLYLTNERKPCTFIERFDASFKISFENPRVLFEDVPFEEIYKYRDGVTVDQYAAFDIPFLTNPKDKNYDWYDDKIYITDLEKYIPDFRRKLAARMIILAGRKNSMGEYCYYLPYANNPVAEVRDNLIKDLIDRYGFVIALPDVPMMNIHGIIIMDLHVTFIKNTNYKDFSLTHKSELVFNIVRDYKNNEQIAVDTKSTVDIKDKNNINNNISNEDDYMLFQNPQSTPSYSKNDYVLIKGEKKKTLLNKEYFKEIDKITSKLYNFVRQNLFPSMELFSYMKKHTPYAMLFNDFEHYETLIKMFIIKDLGRIYKGLNHSVNFATKEGKPLLLYMEKDMCDNPEVSYEVFNEVCNPKTQFEAAKKLHGVIEDLTKTYYEYDIELWTKEDFLIHSFLKEINKDWANSYLELMSEFASAVKNANGQLSESLKHNLGSSTSLIEELFPLFGITLGETTWKQAEDMGNKVEVLKDSQMRSTDIGDVTFWDDEGVGIFTSLSWSHYSYNPTDFPTIWKSKGFSWDLSYDEWLDVFKKLGFKITVTRQPIQKEFSVRNTLSACFEAISTDGTLEFTMNFDYGENGSHTSSPRSLHSFDLYLKGPTDAATDQKEFSSDVKGTNSQMSDPLKSSLGDSVSIIDEFFPLFGITLGETTCKQAEDMGYKVKPFIKNKKSRIAEVGEIDFWDYNGDGVFTSLSWYYMEYKFTDFPPLWKSKGFSWDSSYDEWMDVFKKLGFEITVTQQPTQHEFAGHNSLHAEFEALSPNGILLFTLAFDHGTNGCYTSSPKSLSNLSLYYEGDIKVLTGQKKSDEVKEPDKLNPDGEYYHVTDSPEGGKHVSMGVIVPEEGDKDFEFCSYNCHIDDKEKINIITEYMKRFEEGKESRPFLMIGRPCLGLDDIDIFYSLDGKIIFNFIFDEKIKGWIREAGFVLGKVKEYHMFELTDTLDLTLSVSKRKSGEKLFNQASEEAMDFIEEYAVAITNTDVKEKIINAVEDFKKGISNSPYKVLIISKENIGVCTTIDGEEIAMIVNDEIINLARKNKGAIGYITDVDYDDDGINKNNVWFTIKVSRSIPRISLDQDS